MRIQMVSALLGMTLGVCASASAQSLGEIARENEKAKKGKPTKVYTEDDLRRSGGTVSSGAITSTSTAPATTPATAGAPSGTPAAGAGTAPGTSAEKKEEEVDKEAEWKGRWTKASEDVTRLAKEVDRLQTELNNTGTDQYGPGRIAVQNRFEEAKKTLAAAQKVLEDLEEERRRGGIRRP